MGVLGNELSGVFFVDRLFIFSSRTFVCVIPFAPSI